MTQLGWTDERVEQLRTAWASGLSCSAIAEKIGGATRNAIIGKAHRLKLPTRKVTREPGAKPGRAVRVRSARNSPQCRSAAETLLIPPPIIPEPSAETRVEFADLNNRNCHWPIGDPKAEGFLFCGADREHRNYCRYHHAMAFMKPEASRRPGLKFTSTGVFK